MRNCELAGTQAIATLEREKRRLSCPIDVQNGQLTFQDGLDALMHPFDDTAAFVRSVAEFQKVAIAVEAYNLYDAGGRNALGTRAAFLRRLDIRFSDADCSRIHAAAPLWRQLSARCLDAHGVAYLVD